MLRYQNISIPTGNVENLANALSGLGERKRKIHAFLFHYAGTNSPSATNERFRVYKEQDQIVDYSVRNFVFPFASTDFEPTNMPFKIEVDMDLEIGEGLQVGVFLTSGTTNSWNCTMVYEDL